MRPIGEPATALRSALSSPWEELRDAARRVIRRALEAPTFGAAAKELEIGRRTLERIRADFPGDFDRSAPAFRRPRGRPPGGIDQFWSRVNRGDRASCWEWMGARTSRGYGWVVINRKQWTAHRFVYALTRGGIPAGMVVRHTCDNPACCNPDHLLAGTHTDNMRDCKQRKRNVRALGERVGASKLTESKVREIRERASAGESRRRLAAEFGVTAANIAAVVRRKTWVHVQ